MQLMDGSLWLVWVWCQTKLLQGKFDETQAKVLSYGPCQFPTLGFVAARDRRIESFRPEHFWHLDLEVLGGASAGGGGNSGDDDEEEEEEKEEEEEEDGNDDGDGDGDNHGEDDFDRDNGMAGPKRGGGGRGGAGRKRARANRGEDKGSKAGGGSGGTGGGTGGGKGGGRGGDKGGGVSERARFMWGRNRVYDRAVATVLFDMATRDSNTASGGEGVKALITSVRRAPTSKTRPCPMNTVSSWPRRLLNRNTTAIHLSYRLNSYTPVFTSLLLTPGVQVKLQLEASVHLRLASDRTMKVAEELYAKGLLSYPRTETERCGAQNSGEVYSRGADGGAGLWRVFARWCGAVRRWQGASACVSLLLWHRPGTAPSSTCRRSSATSGDTRRGDSTSRFTDRPFYRVHSQYTASIRVFAQTGSRDAFFCPLSLSLSRPCACCVHPQSTRNRYAAHLQDTPGRFQFPRPGKEDDKAHPPIHPVALATDLQVLGASV